MRITTRMQNTKINKLMSVGVLGVTAFAMSSGVAFAQRNNNYQNNNNNNYYQPIKNVQNKVQDWTKNFNQNNSNNSQTNNYNVYVDQNDASTNLEIGNDGSVVMRGATVSSISGNTVYVNSVLGSATLTWTVTLDGNTKLEARNGRTIQLGDIAAGDKVTVKGVMLSGSSLSLRATLVRDITKASQTTPVVNNGSKQTFQGRLVSVASNGLPTSVVVTIGNTNTTVNLGATTILLNNAWGVIPMTTFQVGDTVRVFGYIPSGTNQITCLVLRTTSR